MSPRDPILVTRCTAYRTLELADLCSMRILLSVAILISAHGTHLRTPLFMHELPAELVEVSGLTDVSDSLVACLQDEEALLYLLDVHDGTVMERHRFGPPGDMEGLTRVKDGFYALRSDGLVYHLRKARSGYALADTFRLRLPNRDIEGLGYDETRGVVLVAPKDVLKGDPQLRDRRQLFAFDPHTHQLLPEPVLSYTLSGILQQARDAGITIPVRTTPKGRQVPELKLRMASVAVDPVTDHYVILSATDRTLLVLDREGRFVHLYFLDPDRLPKPEGLTFLPDGRMLIASEGRNGPARLLGYSGLGLQH